MLDQVWAASFGAAATLCAAFVGAWIQHQRTLRQFALQDKVQAAAKELLNSERWDKRGFQAIKERLGGFEDNELRKILVAVGAVRFKAQDGGELWGLVSRNREFL